MEQELFDIPKILYFESNNIYSGSLGKFNYKIFPDGEVLRAHIWHGIYCMEKSEVLDTQEFPMTAEGRTQLIDWLTQKHRQFLVSDAESL